MHESKDDDDANIVIDIQFFLCDILINKKDFHGKRFMDLYETEYFLLYQNLGLSLTHNFRPHFRFKKTENEIFFEKCPVFQQRMGCVLFRYRYSRSKMSSWWRKHMCLNRHCKLKISLEAYERAKFHSTFRNTVLMTNLILVKRDLLSMSMRVDNATILLIQMK